ncbi:acetyl-coenzyme A transporter 1-like protein [Dinothrombium tinctorium]|uniref:Acetyl-coenzyme A transporter 1-like protein n=1 Tax=Dinothrombium tinctorium TaxID=1965070 RepID=A0A3S3NYS8_9ACAR|nr:acetyl-coenzyme A transporter 1-like protein [Dinothrombium tinctorium]RWS08651.1 acetyl-coenzyme A transporter 1-like protein [Dinothrombium tinctorium]RWS09504.1 acetyl-coenzyme A transporter 1-like protein [Dinothrombium tinctorium]RWS09510.1 acetyl-coenzyme A transporter 1-like protein [Dinothrombium tinctorium]
MTKKQSFDVICEHEKNQINSKEEMLEKNKGLKGDYLNLFLLLILYFMQGIPIGIGEVIPLILVNKGVTYDKQALFSLAAWPFSLKLLWAPIVDSIYAKRFGRRKTWFVPVQYGIGFFLVLLGLTSKQLLGDADAKSSPKMVLLTIIFFLLIFLTATQDIAVDGWALTLLSKHNIHYAASCNSVGQTVGVLFGNTVFLALESVDFANKWLRKTKSDTGIVTFEGYSLFWGMVCLIVTTCVWIFKRERDEITECGESKINVIETYKMLWRILCLPSVRWFAVVLLTCKIATATSDSVTSLKLVEYGLKRDNIGILRLPLIPIQLILPWLVARFTRENPMKSFYFMYPFRLLIAFTYAFVVWWTSVAKSTDGSFNVEYYIVLVFAFAIVMVSGYCTDMALWAFNAQVSDPLIGGTYMTLLMTLTNLGNRWPSTVALYFVKVLTFRWCPNDGFFCSKIAETTINKLNQTNLSINSSALNQSNTSETIDQYLNSTIPFVKDQLVDGYYVEIVISLFIGIIWILLIHSTIKWLQSQPSTSWRCKVKNKSDGTKL